MRQASSKPDLRSFNTLLARASGLAWHASIWRLWKLRTDGFDADAFSFNDAMKSCRGQWIFALQIFEEICQTQVEANVVHCNEVMCNLQEDPWQLAAHIYDTMLASGVSADRTLRNTLRALNGPWSLGLALAMEDAIGTTALLGKLGAAWSAAVGLLQAAMVQRLSDGICVNAAADACRTGPWRVAVHLGQETSDSFGFYAGASAAESGAAWEVAGQLLAEAKALRLSGAEKRRLAEPSGAASGWQQMLASVQVPLRSSRCPPAVLDVLEVLEAASKWPQALNLLPDDAPGRFRSHLAAAATEAENCWEAALHAAGRNSSSLETSYANSMMSACGRRLQWAEAFRFLGLMPLWRMEPRATGLNAAISTSAATGNWMHAFHMVEQMAGMQLIPDEISLGTLMNSLAPSCRRDAFQLLMSLDSSIAPWSSSFLPWALAKLRLRPTPWRLAAAFAAALAVDATPRGADVAALAWAAATLNVFSVPLAEKITADARLCMKDFSNEELRILTAAVRHWPPALLRLLREIWGELRRRLRSGAWLTTGDDWKDLLGVVASPYPAFEAGRVNASQIFQPDADPVVALDLSDRLVVYKPVGWEVYDNHSPQQLIDFVRGNVGPLPIFQDLNVDLGFLHRLDVPSSGLLLAAKTYEAYADLQLQLHTGQILREYAVLCHGFVPHSRSITARLWDISPVTEVGLGKAASTRIKVGSYGYVPVLAMTFTVVTIQIDTGRKHQIRSHMAHIGHAVVRDGRYSSAVTFYGDSGLCGGSFLHRHRLGFAADRRYDIQVPLPEELKAALPRLEPWRGSEQVSAAAWCSGLTMPGNGGSTTATT